MVSLLTINEYGKGSGSTKQMGFPFYLYNILVDGKQTNYISNSISSGTKTVSFAIRNAWKKKSN